MGKQSPVDVHYIDKAIKWGKKRQKLCFFGTFLRQYTLDHFLMFLTIKLKWK